VKSEVSSSRDQEPRTPKEIYYCIEVTGTNNDQCNNKMLRLLEEPTKRVALRIVSVSAAPQTQTSWARLLII